MVVGGGGARSTDLLRGCAWLLVEAERGALDAVRECAWLLVEAERGALIF